MPDGLRQPRTRSQEQPDDLYELDVPFFDVEEERSHPPSSPHLLDLTVTELTVPEEPPTRKRRIAAALRQALDEKIHLHDLRVRTLSVRPRGWKDFPPQKAATLGQAAWMTLARFFNEHPLADLTMITLLHMTIMLIWRLVIKPTEIVFETLVGPKEQDFPTIAAPTLLPMMPEPVPVKKARPQRKPFFLMALNLEKPPGWRKTLLGFASISLLFILPIGAYSSLDSLRAGTHPAIAQSLNGVTMLQSAGEAAKNHDFESARAAFAEAERHFANAKEMMGPVGRALLTAGSFLPGHPLSSAAPMLTTGEEIARGGVALSSGLAGLDSESDPATRLRLLSNHLESSLPHLDRAAAAVSRISEDAVPERHRGILTLAKREVPDLTDGVRHAADISRFLSVMMGIEEPKRYLMLFQNDAEMRATGGFIGSFALVDVDKGIAKNVEIPGGGSYDLQGSLRARVISPQPLHLINPHWQFQDGNWSPDFPTSADRLAWFYEKSGGPTTDGVIAVTARFMENLLKVVGPVELPDYEMTLDSENFRFETQKKVEIDYDRGENRPKQFIADLAPLVMESLAQADKTELVGLIDLFNDSLAQKDLQFWFRHEDMQTQASDLGWTGEIKDADGDYLFVVHTNIAGQKTDRVMKEDISHETKILSDGTAIVTLTITRTHQGIKGDLFTGVRNVDYLRVYVPEGSVLVDTDGFDAPNPTLFKIPDPEYVSDGVIGEQEENRRTDRASGTHILSDHGKTVFGNWVQTDPGQTSIVTLVYQLPPGTVKIRTVKDNSLAGLYGKLVQGSGASASYSLTVQKQAGGNPSSFTKSIDIPRGFHVGWSSDEMTLDDRGRWTTESVLDSDDYISAIAESPL